MKEVIDSFHDEYRFLSNFYPHTIEYEGLTYTSSEAAYQAAKSESPEVRKFFLNLSPSEAKELGKKIKVRSTWYFKRISVMEEILTIKFSDPILAQKLRDTYPATLIEGNWWGDTFWGVCDGMGRNNLGLILMKIRDRLLKDSI